jgi:hypothetical protein
MQENKLLGTINREDFLTGLRAIGFLRSHFFHAVIKYPTSAIRKGDSTARTVLAECYEHYTKRYFSDECTRYSTLIL